MKALVNLALALLSCALFLLGLEGVLRLLPPTKPTKNRLYLYSEFDPLLGWRKTPLAHARFELREYSVDMKINSRGLRGPERDYTAPAGVPRILTLGDSFTEGYSVALQDSLQSVLESSLGVRGCRAEVINAGTAGYSTDQEYLFYSNEGRKYQPRVVVLFFYYNDILQNTEDHFYRRAKPLFEVVDGRLRLTNTPLPTPRPEPPTPDDPEPAPRGSRAFAFFEDRMRQGSPAGYNRLARVGFWPPLESKKTPRDLKVYRRKAEDETREAWERTTALLEALSREVTAQGARFLLVHIPQRFEVSDRDFARQAILFGWNERNTDRRAVINRLREIGKAAGFPVLDPTEALQSVDRGVFGDGYYVYDEHWNALGHGVAAREVERFLQRESWLNCGGTSPN